MERTPRRRNLSGKTWYRHYVLVILVLVYAINIMDRQVLALLLEDIKAEFLLSDAQLGLLSGLAFGLFYAIMGIPLARVADKGDKARLLAACVALWSLATALCGVALGFVSLLLARILTAVGEAGGSPPSHALISEYYAPVRRATALSIYALGVPLGAIIGNIASGWLNEYFSWRLVFIVMGLPGLAAALLVLGTVSDPAAASGKRKGVRQGEGVGLGSTLRHLWRCKTYVHMCLAASLHSVAWYAGSAWNAVFLMRSHGLGSGYAGSLIASFAVFGLAGTFAGGFLADRLTQRYQDARWYLWVPGIAIVLMVPLQFGAYLSPVLEHAIIYFWGMTFLASTFFGPSYAVSQAAAGPGMRATAASILIFTQTLIGMGVGPYLAGLLSDELTPVFGAGALGYALVLVGMSNLWSACHYALGGKSQDLCVTEARGEAVVQEACSGR